MPIYDVQHKAITRRDLYGTRLELLFWTALVLGAPLLMLYGLAKYPPLVPNRESSPSLLLACSRSLHRPGDSVVVATVDIENGRFTKLGILGGEWLGRIRWLEDGNIMFDFRETQGAYVLYTTKPGGPTRRLADLPYTEDTRFSVSKDGMRAAAFSYSIKSDVYMIRNFGAMLRRGPRPT